MTKQRILWIVAACCLAAPPAAFSQDHPSFQTLWDSVAANPDCIRTEYPDLFVATCAKDFTLWYFTKPGHPAHPGVIKRSVEQRAGGVYTDEQGWSFASDADQPAFKAWLGQIQDLDRKAKERWQNEHGDHSQQTSN